MPKDQSINFLATSTRSIENRIFGVWVSLRFFSLTFWSQLLMSPSLLYSGSSQTWLQVQQQRLRAKHAQRQPEGFDFTDGAYSR